MSFNVSYNLEVTDDATPQLNRIARGFAKLSKAASTLAQKLGKSSEKLGKFGRSMSLKATLPLAAFAGFAVKAAVSFQQAINMVGADTNATAKQLSMLRKEALKYGASTQFTAVQVAQAEFHLGRAGIHVHRIMRMLPGVLQLAASAQLDMGTASKVAIQVMKGYGFQAKDLAHVNNILVKTFTSSNTDLLTLSESFKLSGPILKSAGVKFKDAAAFIAVLGNAGIQATMAGTGMRKVVQSLLNPNSMLKKSMKRLNMTFIDAKTGQLDLLKTMKELHDQGLTTAGALKGFGVKGGNAMAALLEHYPDLIKMDNELNHTGNIAKKIADANMMGLPGATKRLTSAFGNMRLELVDSVTPALEGLMGWLTKLLSHVNKSSTGFRKWISWTIGATMVTGPLLMALAKLALIISLLGKWGIVINVLKALRLAFIGLWRGILGPIGLLIAIGVAIFMLYKKFKLVRTVVKGIGKFIMFTFEPIILLFKTIIKLGSWIAKKFHHKTAPAITVRHEATNVPTETPRSVFGGARPVAAGGAYAKSPHVLSTLNIKVADKNKTIAGISGESTADVFNMNLGTNMSMARY